MQIPSIPPPIVTNTLPQDVAAKAVPVIQAAAPLAHNPVLPGAKADKFSDKGGDKDRHKRHPGQQTGENGESDENNERGGSLNIRV